jgi:hypothetical protein
MTTRTCPRCGCTDDHACVERNGLPCSWVPGSDLCSKCYNRNPGPGTFSVCAWCKANNAIDPKSRPLYCWRCHHRADVPTPACSCPTCVPQTQLTMFQDLGARHQDQ